MKRFLTPLLILAFLAACSHREAKETSAPGQETALEAASEPVAEPAPEAPAPVKKTKKTKKSVRKGGKKSITR